MDLLEESTPTTQKLQMDLLEESTPAAQKLQMDLLEESTPTAQKLLMGLQEESTLNAQKLDEGVLQFQLRILKAHVLETRALTLEKQTQRPKEGTLLFRMGIPKAPCHELS